MKRRIGTTELYVNPVGLGCMGFSHASGDPTPETEAVETIRQAIEYGYDFLDTAECYTGVYPDGTISYNEELVGKAVKGRRDQVVIATKTGVYHNPDRSLRLDSSPANIRRAVEESLTRLQTDCIDLYYQHRVDPKVEPEVVAEVMGQLIQEGKIRAWGISEVKEDYLRRAHAVTPVSAIENRYSMMARWHESIFPVCQELGISYIAFSPLANGILSGVYNSHTVFEGRQDYRADMPQYSEEGYRKAEVLLNCLRELAEERKCTMAQLSLAWMINRKDFIIPIPGSRKIERLKSNFEAGKIILGADEINSIDEKLNGMEFDVFGGHRA
ncbi:MAG: aldo/keto reductase [Bulleidia sp.]